MNEEKDSDCDVTTILNDDCWEKIFSYLDPMSQLQLSKTNQRLHFCFKDYAKRRYKNIDTTCLESLETDEFEELLSNVGEHVKNYASPRIINSVWNKREYYAYMNKQGKVDYEKRHFRRCRSITCVSDNLVFRALQYEFKRHFQIPLSYCKNIESFEFGKYLANHTNYELVCDLPKLKQLFIWTDGELRSSFLNALENKQGTKLQRLSIKGLILPIQQVIQICRISSLTDLCVSCSEVPLEHLLTLQQLESLHLTIPFIENDQALELVKGLPHLHTLNLRDCSWITDEFVLETQEWIRSRDNLKRKLCIYLQGSDVTWKIIDEKTKQWLEFIKKEEDEVVLIKGELSQAYI